jgi:hypothetical protein
VQLHQQLTARGVGCSGQLRGAEQQGWLRTLLGWAEQLGWAGRGSRAVLGWPGRPLTWPDNGAG